MPNDLDALAAAFANAHRNPGETVRAADLVDLSRAEAMAIQGKVAQLLGDRINVAKVAKPKEGTGTAAPIPANLVIDAGGVLDIDKRHLVGLEIEVAAVLRADVTPERARMGHAAVREAIDHYILGIELIGSRIDDRSLAGPFGTLADWMITGGYVRGKDRLNSEPRVNGLPVKLVLDGAVIQREIARHPFGDAVTPILTYAAAADDSFGGLRNGMTVTTGSLSPLLLLPHGGKVEIRLGNLPPVAFTLQRDRS